MISAIQLKKRICAATWREDIKKALQYLCCKAFCIILLTVANKVSVAIAVVNACNSRPELVLS